MIVNERHHHLPGRSSSAWAKYAEALRRISLARLSSRFSRSSAFSRSRSSLVTPGLSPWSRSAWRTHLRRVSAVHPIVDAIDDIADHCDSYSVAWSKTIRTARSRTSGEYCFACFMTPCSQGLESPGIPGRFRLLRHEVPDSVACWMTVSVVLPTLMRAFTTASGQRPRHYAPGESRRRPMSHCHSDGSRTRPGSGLLRVANRWNRGNSPKSTIRLVGAVGSWSL